MKTMLSITHSFDDNCGQQSAVLLFIYLFYLENTAVTKDQAGGEHNNKKYATSRKKIKGTIKFIRIQKYIPKYNKPYIRINYGRNEVVSLHIYTHIFIHTEMLQEIQILSINNPTEHRV